jgi:hypothetical protein
MSTESRILLSDVSTESQDSSFVYGSKQPGAGYNRRSDGVHTVIYSFDNFSGTVKVQGTLELYPAEDDWFDILETELGGDSTVVTSSSYSRNFTGNFLYIRAAYNLQNGSITEIRYNL